VLTVDANEVMAAARREQTAAVERCGLHHLLEDRPGTWGMTRCPDAPGFEI
jgi:hypothetical protein